MSSATLKKIIPCKKEQLIEMVLDIEKYPEFVPWCIKGKIFDVALDLRTNSKTFGKTYCCILSEKNKKSIYIPPGFAHGFQSLENENYIVYGCTKYRNKKSEQTIAFNDKYLRIKWPNRNIVTSKKDENGISYLEYIKNNK